MPTAKAMVLKGSGWDKFELRSFPLVEPGPGVVVADVGHTVHDFINALELMKKAKEAGIPYGDIVRDVRSYIELPSAIKDVKNKVVPGKIAIRPS